MGEIKIIRPVKLITGFIFYDEAYFTSAKNLLEKKFSKTDFESKTLTFTHTHYYEKEMGGDLKRKFISFKRLIYPTELFKIKIFANKIERRFLIQSKRKINIDPGYLDLSKLILLSTKDYKHRVYLNKGVFAEATLFFENNTFRAWECTYPDYRTPDYIQIFNQIREIYLNQIKH